MLARCLEEPKPMIDAKLLDVLACPHCKGPLRYRKQENELVCAADRLAFPVVDGIPVMLEEEARHLDPVETV
jgi:tetraacyldisaccharide 4'-kinase